MQRESSAVLTNLGRVLGDSALPLIGVYEDLVQQGFFRGFYGSPALALDQRCALRQPAIVFNQAGGMPQGGVNMLRGPRPPTVDCQSSEPPPPRVSGFGFRV